MVSGRERALPPQTSSGRGKSRKKTPGHGRGRKIFLCFSLFLFIYPLDPKAPGSYLFRENSAKSDILPLATLPCRLCAGGTEAHIPTDINPDWGSCFIKGLSTEAEAQEGGRRPGRQGHCHHLLTASWHPSVPHSAPISCREVTRRIRGNDSKPGWGTTLGLGTQRMSCAFRQTWHAVLADQ